MTESIGIIEEERLILIPRNHWGKHQLCFHLHDQLVHMLKQYEASGIHNVVTSAFLESIRGREQEFEGVNILSEVRERNLIEPYRHHVLSHVVLALTPGFCSTFYKDIEHLKKCKALSLWVFRYFGNHLKNISSTSHRYIADDADFISRFNCRKLRHAKWGNKRSRQMELDLKRNKSPRLKQMFDPERRFGQ